MDSPLSRLRYKVGETITCGVSISPAVYPILASVMEEVYTTGKQIRLEDTTQQANKSTDEQTLLAVPLHTQENVTIGVLLIGKRGPNAFQHQQQERLGEAAKQVALLVQAVQRFAGLEYRTLVDERIRLAREIHDGLAQTLGFIKLQVAQMQGYLERGDTDRLRQMLKVSYSALAEAYQDAREAIDGLRVMTIGEAASGWISLSDWIRQVASEFEEHLGNHSLLVNLTCLDIKTPISPEVHAQLIRIIQESLSNVRKHAQAEQLWISCRETEGYLVLEVRDDGRGFSSDNMPKQAQHGLHGMRERAEVIGADFQVISRPGEGTTVHVRLPLPERYRLEALQ